MSGMSEEGCQWHTTCPDVGHLYDPRKINEVDEFLYCQCGKMRIRMDTAKDFIKEQNEKQP